MASIRSWRSTNLAPNGGRVANPPTPPKPSKAAQQKAANGRITTAALKRKPAFLAFLVGEK